MLVSSISSHDIAGLFLVIPNFLDSISDDEPLFIIAFKLSTLLYIFLINNLFCSFCNLSDLACIFRNNELEFNSWDCFNLTIKLLNDLSNVYLAFSYTFNVVDTTFVGLWMYTSWNQCCVSKFFKQGLQTTGLASDYNLNSFIINCNAPLCVDMFGSNSDKLNSIYLHGVINNLEDITFPWLLLLL